MGAIDIVILLLLIMFAVVGFKQGVIKEAVQLVGMLAILVISFLFKDELGNIFCKWLPFFEFTGTQVEGLVSLNILIYQLLGFAAIFLVLYAVYTIVLKISGIFQKIIDWTPIFLLPSKIGGLIIGVIEGYIIIFVLLLILLALPANVTKIYRNSTVVNTIVYKTPILSNAAKDVTSSFKDVVDLTDQVINKKIETNDANLKIIDVMLKYDIVTPKTVEQLVVLDKLKSVKGIEAIIEKHK